MICLSILSYYTAGAQIPDEEAIEVGFRRVLARQFTIDLIPDFEATDAALGVNGAYDGEMRLVIRVQPVEEKPDDVIGAQTRPCGVRKHIPHVSALLIRRGIVPYVECPPDKLKVFLALNSLVDRFAKVLKSIDD